MHLSGESGRWSRLLQKGVSAWAHLPSSPDLCLQDEAGLWKAVNESSSDLKALAAVEEVFAKARGTDVNTRNEVPPLSRILSSLTSSTLISLQLSSLLFSPLSSHLSSLFTSPILPSLCYRWLYIKCLFPIVRKYAGESNFVHWESKSFYVFMLTFQSGKGWQKYFFFLIFRSIYLNEERLLFFIILFHHLKKKSFSFPIFSRFISFETCCPKSRLIVLPLLFSKWMTLEKEGLKIKFEFLSVCHRSSLWTLFDGNSLSRWSEDWLSSLRANALLSITVLPWVSLIRVSGSSSLALTQTPRTRFDEGIIVRVWVRERERQSDERVWEGSLFLMWWL